MRREANKERVQVRNAEPEVDVTVLVDSAKILRDTACRIRDILHRGEFDRLTSGDCSSSRVTDKDLHRRQDCRKRERDSEAECVIPVAASFENPERIDGGHSETCDQIRGKYHVRGLV